MLIVVETKLSFNNDLTFQFAYSPADWLHAAITMPPKSAVSSKSTASKSNASRANLASSAKGKRGANKANLSTADDLEACQKELEEMKRKLRTISQKLIGVTDVRWKKTHCVLPDVDPILVDEQLMEAMIEELVVKRKLDSVSTEMRVDELERRVTQMSFDMARYRKKCEAYEQGLQMIVSSRDLTTARDMSYQLQFLAGQKNLLKT